MSEHSYFFQTSISIVKDKPEVSVIVPVYNVEPYLRRCVDSLIGQTLQNIEIILVDDGSTDGCGQICNEYAAKDTRIRVIHQKNAGLSEARNAGIDVAIADYLLFVDSDDWVEWDFCEIPLKAAKEYQADLVMFQRRYIMRGHIIKRRFSICDGIKTQGEALNLLVNGVGMTAWNKLYHRDLFRTNRYPKGKVCEDTALTPVLVHEANTIAYSSAILYNHEYRDGSISTVLSDNLARDWFDAVNLTVRHLKEWGFESLADQYKQISILSFLSRSWRSSEITNNYIQYLRSLRRCPSFFSFKQRCQFYLCIISPKLYHLFYRAYCFFRLYTQPKYIIANASYHAK